MSSAVTENRLWDNETEACMSEKRINSCLTRDAGNHCRKNVSMSKRQNMK